MAMKINWPLAQMSLKSRAEIMQGKRSRKDMLDRNSSLENDFLSQLYAET